MLQRVNVSCVQSRGTRDAILSTLVIFPLYLRTQRRSNKALCTRCKKLVQDLERRED